MSRMRSLTDFSQTVADLLAAGLVDVTAKVVEADLQPIMVGAQLLKEDTSLVGSTGTTKRFPRKHDTLAEDFAEGDDVPVPGNPVTIPEIAYEYVSTTPSDYGVGEIITKQTILAADWNAINDTKDSLVMAMAQKADDICWEGIANAKTILGETLGGALIGWGLIAGNTNYLDTHPTVPNYQGHILELLSVEDVAGGGVLTPITDYTFDYALGIFNLVAAPTGVLTVDYVYSDSVAADNPNTDYANLNYYTVSTNGSYGYTDLVRQKYQVIGQNGMPDTVILDELAAEDLTLDQKFIDASQVADKVVMNGLIGKIGGMSVVMTQHIWPAIAICLKSKDIGYKVYKEKMNSRQEIVQARANDIRIMVWESASVAINHAELISICFNAAPDADTGAPA